METLYRLYTIPAPGYRAYYTGDGARFSTNVEEAVAVNFDRAEKIRQEFSDFDLQLEKI